LSFLLEDAKLMADYLHLPVRLVERLAAHQAVLALAEDVSEGLAGRLLEQADLRGLVQDGLKAFCEFTKPLEFPKGFQLPVLPWAGHLESARLPLVRGLVGEAIDKDAHDFEKAMNCCGRLFAGRQLPYKLLPSYTDLGGTEPTSDDDESDDDDSDDEWDDGSEPTSPAYLDLYIPIAVIAAALGKADVLEHLADQNTRWVVMTPEVVRAAAFTGQRNVLDLVPPELAYYHVLGGAAQSGLPGLALIKELFEDADLGDREASYHFYNGLRWAEGDVQQSVDFMIARGANLSQAQLARFGDLTRLTARVQADGGIVETGVLEEALEGGHKEVALWCLANGATFDQGNSHGSASALASVCRGFKGDASALQFWLDKGALATFWALGELCEAAASLGYTAALEFAKTLSSFKGWKNEMANSVLDKAMRTSQATVLRWVASRPSFKTLESKMLQQDYMLKATFYGDLEVVKACIEGWGLAIDGFICRELVLQGPSHRHIVDFLASAVKDVSFEDQWVDLAERFKPEMRGGLQAFVDAGLKLAPAFGEEAAAKGVVSALDFAWDNGSRDVKTWAEKAFRNDKVATLEWLKKKDSKGLAAVPLDSLKKLAPRAKEVNKWAGLHGPWKKSSAKKEPSQVGNKRALSEDDNHGKGPAAKRPRKDEKPTKEEKKKKQTGKGTKAAAKVLKPKAKKK
jgi:hypothetical protein